MNDEHYRANFEGAMHELDRARAKSREQRAVVDEQLSALAFDAQTQDGSVYVSVNAQGLMQSLRLGPGVSAMTPDQIADAVMRTYAYAQREVASQVGQLLAPIVSDSDRLRELMAKRTDFAPEDAQQDAQQPPSADDSGDETIDFSRYRA